MGGPLRRLALPAILALALPIVLVVAIVAACAGGPLNVSGLSATEAQVAQYFKSKGMSNVSIAAIMANMRVEVGGEVGDDFDADQIQDGHDCLAPSSYANCPGGGAHGLFQLEAGSDKRGRFVSLNEFAQEKGSSWKDVATQCEYMYEEDMPEQFELYSGVYGEYSEIYGPAYDGVYGIGRHMSFDEWQGITDVDWATQSFCQIVERAGMPHMDRRKGHAREYLAILSSPAAASSSETVSRAQAELGKPYVWGAVGPDSYDCSGLVGYALTGRHERIGTTETFMGWPRVGAEDAQPGDVVTSATHCGIYIGDGQMIHAPHTGDVVKIGPVQSGMVYVRYPG